MSKLNIEVKIDTSTPEGERTAREIEAQTMMTPKVQESHLEDCRQGRHVEATMTGNPKWCLWCAKVLT